MYQYPLRMPCFDKPPGHLRLCKPLHEFRGSVTPSFYNKQSHMTGHYVIHKWESTLGNNHDYNSKRVMSILCLFRGIMAHLQTEDVVNREIGSLASDLRNSFLLPLHFSCCCHLRISTSWQWHTLLASIKCIIATVSHIPWRRHVRISVEYKSHGIYHILVSQGGI